MNFLRTHRQSRYLLAYIGDGANDSEAIKEADIGIMFGESELSLGGTFTSRTQDLDVILTIIREGKATMNNGLVNFQFFLFYILNNYVATLMLYSVYIGFRDYHGLMLGYGVSYICGIIIAEIGPSPFMTPLRPKHTIFHKKFFVSVLATLFLSFTLLFYGWNKLRAASFYHEPLQFISTADRAVHSFDVNLYLFYDNHYVFVNLIMFNSIYFLVINFAGPFKLSLSRMKR